MTASELRLKDTAELKALGEDLRKEYFQVKMQHHTGQLSDVAQIRTMRREIARIETLLHERKMAGAEGSQQ